MPLPALSPRLALIAGKVPRGCRVADIGCDHAALCVWLVMSGLSPSALALDAAEGPLMAARETIEAYCCGRAVTPRLTRGFSNIGANEFDCAVIAGMGGDTIYQILADIPFAPPPGTSYILQPMTRDEQLRAYLAAAGYQIIGEDLVREKRRLYVVMTVTYTGVCRQITLEESVFGSIPAAHPLWPDYRDSRLNRLRKEYDGRAEKNKDTRYLQIENILRKNMLII